MIVNLNIYEKSINGINFALDNPVFHRILDFKPGWISILALFFWFSIFAEISR